MATDQKPEGFLGNLNPDQEAKLRQLWKTIFRLYDMYESNDPELQAAIKNSAKEAETASKSRFGFFRGESNQHKASSNVIEHYLSLGAADANDKFALRKQFMDMLASHTPESIRGMVIEAVKHDHPDALALRFLRARKWEVDKALVMMFTAMNWRYNESKVDSDIMKNGDGQAALDENGQDTKTKAIAHDFLRQLRMGKGYLHGVDRENRPISCVRVRLHKPFDQKVEALERFIVYLIETGRFALTPPVETACLIFDMTGFTLANMDYVPLKFIIQCFEANYPESLGVILIHNAPWVFKGIWRVVQGWLDPVVAGKVNFTYGREELEKFIAPDQIIKELGGDEDWEYQYDEPVAGENDIMNDTDAKAAILKERGDIAARFEAVTRKWADATPGAESDAMQSERTAIAKESRDNYWKLDPYVRARSLYDRQGFIRGGAEVNWYPGREAKAHAAVTSNDKPQIVETTENKGDDTFLNASAVPSSGVAA